MLEVYKFWQSLFIRCLVAHSEPILGHDRRIAGRIGSAYWNEALGRYGADSHIPRIPLLGTWANWSVQVLLSIDCCRATDVIQLLLIVDQYGVDRLPAFGFSLIRYRHNLSVIGNHDFRCVKHLTGLFFRRINMNLHAST